MRAPELVAELRAARPVAGDELRERVRAIAAAPPPPRRSLGLRLPSRRLALALPAAAALAVAAAGALGLARSGGEGREATPPSATADAGTSLRSGTESATAPPSAAAPAVGAAGSALAPSPTRPQRYAAELTLEVADAVALSAAAQRALRIVDSLGGYVVQSSLDTLGGDGASSLVVRVPTQRVQDAIVRLSALGTVVGQRVSIEDLGEELDGLGRRQAALAAEVARLRRLLAGSPAPEERAALAARLEETRAELARVRAAQAQARADARFATVSLALRTEADAGAAPPPSRLDRALDEAASILAWEGIALLYALVVAGPFALVAAALWLARRTLRRRGDERLLASSP